MQIRNLGSSGLRVSAVGLGCNNFGARLDAERTAGVVHAALDKGITLFDTSDSYGNRLSETFVGQALGPRRKDIVLATKFASPMDDAQTLKGASRLYIMKAVEASLKRLNTDWIDLYQIHRPDPLTPQEETLRALDDLVRQGKVRYIGCSNHPAWKVVESKWLSKTNGLHSYIACQDEYSILKRQPEQNLIPAMEAYGLGLLPYSPLASGLLSGKYEAGKPIPAGTRFASAQPSNSRFLTEKNWTILEALRVFAAEHNRSLLEIAFGWLLSKPVVSSVIAGATSAEQIDANVAAGAVALSADEIAELDKMTA